MLDNKSLTRYFVVFGKFYLLFVFWLVLGDHQNRAQLVKILGNTNNKTSNKIYLLRNYWKEGQVKHFLGITFSLSNHPSSFMLKKI